MYQAGDTLTALVSNSTERGDLHLTVPLGSEGVFVEAKGGTVTADWQVGAEVIRLTFLDFQVKLSDTVAKKADIDGFKNKFDKALQDIVTKRAALNNNKTIGNTVDLVLELADDFTLLMKAVNRQL